MNDHDCTYTQSNGQWHNIAIYRHKPEPEIMKSLNLLHLATVIRQPSVIAIAAASTCTIIIDGCELSVVVIRSKHRFDENVTGYYYHFCRLFTIDRRRLFVFIVAFAAAKL